MNLASDYSVFTDYLGDRKILIADSSGVARSAVAKLLGSMGAKDGSILLSADYGDAETQIETHEPLVVVCDYDLDQKCGLELIQKHRSTARDGKRGLFILVTGNTSQTAVAQAAEEDVDSYILKPFTPAGFRAAFLMAVMAKVNPSDYLMTIERGKALMGKGKIDDAAAEFTAAVRMDPSPSLAFSYLGQTHLVKQTLNDAEGNYLQGLEYNKFHYKCLVGLYEVLMATRRHPQAYEVIRRIAQFFPANPHRLSAVIRLAILTSNYEDVQKYYLIFTHLEERTEELVKTACAGMIIAGKHLAKKGARESAIEHFAKAAAGAAGRTRILREVVVGLADCGLAKEAELFLAKFPPDTRAGVDYLVADLTLADRTETAAKSYDRARSYLSKGAQDPALYRILIRRAVELEKNDAAEEYFIDACKKFPDAQGELQTLYDALKLGQKLEKAGQA